MEISQHNKQASMHQNGLDTAKEINSAERDAYQEDHAVRGGSIDSIQGALDAIPEGMGGEVRGALKGLEQGFASNMEDAERGEEHRSNQMKGLMEAKAEMLRLEHEAAERKQKRLAASQDAAEQAGSQLEAYGARKDADAALSYSSQELCSALSGKADERGSLRQATHVAIAQAAYASRSAASFRAMSRVALMARVTRLQSLATNVGKGGAFQKELQQASIQARSGELSGAKATLQQLHATVTKARRECDDSVKERLAGTERIAKHNLDGAKRAGEDTEGLLTRSSGIEDELKKALNEIVMDARAVHDGASDDQSTRDAMAKLGQHAEADLESLPALFDAVRAAGQDTGKADHRLVDELAAAKAEATSAVVECSALVQLERAVATSF